MKALIELQNTHDDDLDLLMAETLGTHTIDRRVGESHITDRNGRVKHYHRAADGITVEKTDSRFEHWGRYADDLNACQKVAMGLRGVQAFTFQNAVRAQVGDYNFEMITSSARERTIALILTLQKP